MACNELFGTTCQQQHFALPINKFGHCLSHEQMRPNYYRNLQDHISRIAGIKIKENFIDQANEILKYSKEQSFLLNLIN